MLGIHKEQDRVVYQGRAGMQSNPFAYPIHRLEFDCSPGRDPVLSVTFIADNFFKKEVGLFILSMAPWLDKLRFKALPDLFSYADIYECQICHLMYLGDLGLGDKNIAFSLMRQVATIFGSGSIQDFTTKVPNAVRPPQRLSLELQLLR